MKRFKEPIKTLLILLLTASAVFLAWKGSLFSAFFPVRQSPAASPEPQEQTYTAAALPKAAAVTGPGGLCCGVKYDGEAMAELYEGFSAILAEALGSAEEPEVIGRFTWQNRLQEESLFLDYGFTLPINALAAWVGVGADWAGAETGSAFLLDHNGSGSVRLSYCAGDGRYFQCATSASWSTLRALLEEFRPNGAAFAFDLAALEDCDPFSLVLEQLPTFTGVHASSEQSAAAAACGELFGINLGGQSRYTEADGTLVYPGEAGVLRLWTDGTVSYSAAGEAGGTAVSPADRIETARELLDAVHEAFRGEESLFLSGTETDEAGELTLLFSYAVEGVRVVLSDGPAARAVWRDGRLSELMIRPRSYRRTDDVSEVLPEMQAAAAAGSIRRGAAAELVLPDGGEDRLSPVWIVAADGRDQWKRED